MRKFILQIIIVMISYSYSYSQVPNVDPLFEQVYLEDFNAQLDSNSWYTYYPWGPGNFFSQDTVTGWCGTLLDQASMDTYMADTTNRKINNSTAKFICKKETNMAKTWKFYPYPSAECSNLNLSPVPWDPSTCLDEKIVPYKYSNAMLFSKTKFQYGYFDIQFRLPNWVASVYNAYSPTFWLYSGNTQVPWSEIDVFEINGRNGMFTNNIHVDAVSDTSKQASDEQFVNSSNLDLSQWHTAAINWTPDFIDFYLDGTFKRRSVADTNQYLIPMALIIENNVAAGNFCANNVDSSLTNFPITYEIDYIKIHQVKLACDTNKTYVNTNQNNFNSKIYKSLTIGGSGGAATFNNANLKAVAVDYVLLTEGFEVGNNMEFLIDIQPCWVNQQFLPNSVVNESPPLNLKESYHLNHHYSN